MRLDGQLVRRFVYGGSLWPQARIDAAGDVLERYVYASQSHVPDVIVRRDGQRIGLITDALGSVRAAVDIDTGTTLQRLDYDAYGRTTRDTNPGLQPFGFKGALTDPLAEGAGLLWMGVRAYQPSLARFTTPDPAGLTAVWNDPDALASDPVNLIDTDGRWPSRNEIADASAGFGDGMLGLFCAWQCNFGQMARENFGIADKVDTCSAAYNNGYGIGKETAITAFGGAVGKAAVGTVRAVRAGRVAEKAGRGGAAVVRLGQAGENAVRAAYDIGPKATRVINGRTRIFDGLSEEAVTEVKNVKSLSYTEQLRDYTDYARANGLRLDVYVRSGTQLSGPLARADLDPKNPVNIIRFLP